MKKLLVGALVLLLASGGVGLLVFRQGSQWVEKMPTASNQPWAGPAVVSNLVDDTEPDSPSGASSQTSPSNNVKPESSVVQEARRGDLLVAKDGAEYPILTYKTMTLSDPSANQWWTDKINLSGAHSIGFGQKQTLLAIIDTGVSLAHEEFAGRLHENVGEKGSALSENPSILNCTDRGLPLNKSCNAIDDDGNGVIDDESGPTTKENRSLMNCSLLGRPLDKSCNLKDDDGNGLVDDMTGFDFVSFERSVQPGEVSPDAPAVGHGTMVAGVAAATPNNGKGMAGVDSKTKILPIQALGDDGSGDTLSVSRAIRYAADQGAHVINLSLGSAGSDSYMRQAVQYAISKGSVVVAAAGNDGCQCLSFPAAYEEVVAVGASNKQDSPASFSSYGDTLDVLAPGVDIYSTTWSKTNAVSAYNGGLAGTSFAAPIVSGLLTAARSHQPLASTYQLLGAVTEKVNRLTIPASTARTNTLGYGRVDARNVFERASQAHIPGVRYLLYPVSAGSALGNLEPTIPFQLYACENQIGTTPMYRLSKVTGDIYTISAYEKQSAISQGYSVAQVGHYCIGLPTDRPEFVRSISYAAEAENRTLK